MRLPPTVASLLLAGAALAQAQVTIVVSSRATGVERLAAGELAAHLRLLYPSTRFAVGARTGAGANVLVGTPATFPELAAPLRGRAPRQPDSFVVTTGRHGNAATGIVAGADPRGTLFAVYALLEKLGFGFYLSYNTVPPARTGPFRFDGWALADRPLTSTRLVFNWHNFLSGCSTWDLADWQRWIEQAARMRFTGIMVHAYGNNPMFRFTHNGIHKPTGYLSTTARGRDWGTEHILDVRRIAGGAGLFDQPVFGSDAGLVPENETVAAATGLMQQVFQHAAARGLGVTFALDVDTESANPQNIVRALPASARFAVRGIELADPETPEGRAYYRSQIEQLLRTYPEITQLAIWFRGGRNSPWRELQPENFPRSWQEQYAAALARTPSLRADPDAPSMFAIGRIAAAFRSLLDETGHREIALAAGSWRFDFLRAADAYFPPGVALIPLDYDYAFSSDPARQALHAAAAHRPVIPIVWAQHDDHSFAGRPYLPFPGFASLLRRSGSAGFGIIHWSTRPLDLYFKNLAGQVWEGSENELLGTTCRRMAERTFGAAARDAGTQYLLSWIQDAPMFGRETSDRFIDRTLDESPVADGCRRRLQLLDRVRALAQSPAASSWVSYFQDWEGFALDFHRVQGAWQRSAAAVERGDIRQARAALADASPRTAIEQYARTIAHGGATRGEKGILVSLNLRWLPWFEAQRQALGLQPLRIRFAPTAPEPLAQSPGKNTFAFDSARRLWRVLGSAETAAEVRAGTDGDSCSGGLVVDHPVALSLKPLAGALLPGDWNLTIELSAGSAIEVRGAGTHRVDMHRNTVTVPVERGSLQIELRPVDGPAAVCRLVLSPPAGRESAY